MSKVNELRRKATEAVRGRQFDQAIKLYARLCELDPSNGTPRNELGDLYLKTGNTVEAIDCFSLSARLYNDFGLTNNAVAVFKKILRHDPNHLDSIWGLAEIRREQGLDAESSSGYLDFLSRAEQVPDAGKDAFHRRAVELLKTMADDMEVLSRLEDVFRASGMDQEVAAVLIAKAYQAHLEDEIEVRDRYIEHARGACDIFDSLPAYQEYLDKVDPVDYSGGTSAVEAEQPADSGGSDPAPVEPGALSLDDADFDAAFSEPTAAVEEPTGAAPSGPGPEPGATSSPAPSLPDLDFDSDLLDDMAQTVESSQEPAAPADIEAETPQPAANGAGGRGTVDLLEEILADESFNVAADQQSQLDTIAAEMQGQIGGDVDPSDFGGQYELGIVYMDMGLFEQALTAFDAAAKGADYRLGSLEMRGTCLLRLGRDEEAMAAFRDGLAIEGAPDKAYLGLLYGMGCCLELRENHDEARGYFERVAAVDNRFLDVAAKLEASGKPN